MLLQESVDPADLFLVAGAPLPILLTDAVDARIPALMIAVPRVTRATSGQQIAVFPDPAAFGRLMEEAGFTRVSWTRLTAGIAKRHVALGVGRVLTSQRFDEGPLALVVRTASPGPLREHAGH